MDTTDCAPWVSVIINNYNYCRFLGAAIDSALGQSYRRLEVIVVDDGSTYDSRAVIEKYQDRIIPIFKQNGGQASALNAGFARSKGELIFFLDADDVLLPDVAERISRILCAMPNLAKVQYRMQVIDRIGARTGDVKPLPHLPKRSGDLSKQVLAFPFDIPWMATSGNAFSARVLRKILPLPEPQYRLFADMYMSNLSPLFGPVVSLDDFGAQYRVHGANNYEPTAVKLDLHYVRQTIIHARETCKHISTFAASIPLAGTPRAADDILSVSNVAMRMISLRLDPARHPIERDSVWGLFLAGIAASSRRFDVSLLMKIMFIVWFAVVAIVPKRWVPQLAVWFNFPSTRPQLNRLLTLLHLPDR